LLNFIYCFANLGFEKIFKISFLAITAIKAAIFKKLAKFNKPAKINLAVL